MEERLGCLHDAFKTPIAASKQLRICDDSPGGSRAQLLTTLEECLVQEVDDFLSLPSVAGRQRGRIRSFDPLNPPNLGLGLQTSQCGKDSQISLRHRAAAAAAAAASAATPIDMDGLAGTKSGRAAGGACGEEGPETVATALAAQLEGLRLEEATVVRLLTAKCAPLPLMSIW